MSSEPAIQVDRLGKVYPLYDKPSHRLLQMLTRGRRRFYREFPALHDVSFQVGPGETVGLIGRNGSGKSTLLQLICGTLNRTSGTVRTRGRIAALLELGSGFNPEFTGRENVFLNAAILGLDDAEIRARYDDITAFAELGDYMDQPVKTYSSGMQVRLAFAVIAHVDADILVIDEALAVGDAVFVQKCMRFIRGFRERGTLLIASHDMGAILSLCNRAIWLDHGSIRRTGDPRPVAEAYLHDAFQQLSGEKVSLRPVGAPDPAPPGGTDAPGDGDPDPPAVDYGDRLAVRDHLAQARGWNSGDGEILSVRLEHADGSSPDLFRGGEPVRLVIRAKVHRDMSRPILGFLVRDRLGQDLFGENTLPVTARHPVPAAAGSVLEGEFAFRLPMLPNGQYALMASLADGDLTSHVQHHWLHDALIFTVSSSTVRWGLVGVAFQHVRLRQVPP